ncbi:MAG: protelomerase family protein, partial [Sphaerospermopsis kisseleviana]
MTTLTATQLIEKTVELIKVSTDKKTIANITNQLMEDLNNREYRGNQISEKTFLNNRKEFVSKINEIENIPDDLKSEYKGHFNHHAVTTAYEFKYVVKTQENVEIKTTEELKTTEKTKLKTPKKAVTLDAQKLIDLAVSWLDSDNAYVIGLGVALLTGRRQSEIFFYTTFKADDENTMIVQYLSKKRD